MALTMRRMALRLLQGLLVLVVVLYLGDWAVFWVRGGDKRTGTVAVQQFLRTPLKGQKDEFDYLGTVDQACVPALFPHWPEKPCWWLARHPVQWISST